jgi:hypothetical protein
MSADDRKEVLRLINEWNSSRYELFAISQPNEVCHQSSVIIIFSTRLILINVFLNILNSD